MHLKLFKDKLQEHRRLCSETRAASDASQAAVAQYICVSVNGYLEAYIRKSTAELFRKRCDVKSFRIVTKMTKNHYNFKAEKVVSFFNEIYPDKANGIKVFLKSNDVFSDAIGSIVGNKNTIAHEGRSFVTLNRVDEWLEIILRFIDDFDSVCFH